MKHRILSSLIIVFALVHSAQAQVSLLSPESFLGYELGQRFTPHYRVVDYVNHVAEASPRVEVRTYGKTNEGRPLLVAFVSSPSNLSRLEQIRTDNLRLTGLEEGELQGEAPSIVWLSYNVHGNEAVSTEAAMATLFDLADPGNEKSTLWLRNTVVILDPVVNPDGRDRYVSGYNRMVGAFRNVNPDAAEHSEAWPGGRSNHYYFDLNRDWSWLTQKETRARIKLYNRWMPHVHVDFHEQGVNSPYYFAPAAQPYHEVITDWQREFQEIIGKNHASYFDREGWLYFTRQVFDLFYPGYGDTFPTYNGAIGMTYEQGGSGRAGLGVITAEGDTLTLGDRIAHHYTTGLSTVEMASVHHDRVIGEFKAFFDGARANPPGNFRTYVISGSSGRGRLKAIKSHLDGLGIAHGAVTSPRRSKGFSYRTGQEEDFDISTEDLVISAFQPRATLLSVLFEPESALEDSITYDITAWALPYIYDVDAYATTDRIDTDTEWSAGPGGVESGSDRPYAWLAGWEDPADVRFLSELLQKDIKIRFAERSFTIDGTDYSPGTLIIARAGNQRLGDRLDTMVREAALAFGEKITGVTTGYVDEGSDFGSRRVHYLKRPKIAVLTGSPVSSSSVGEIWHYFDQQIEYPVTLVPASNLERLDLDKYDVLILPSGGYGSLLSESRLDALKTWVRAGGRLVAIESAATFLAGKDGFSIKQKKDAKDDGEDKDEDKDEDKNDENLLKVYANREREGVTRGVAGAIYRVTVDNTHPLAFGFTNTSFALKRRTGPPAYMEGSGSWNVGVVEEGSHVSGQVGYEAAKKIEGSLVYGVQNMGAGAVVYLVDNPLFRGFWYSGRLLLGNAVFLVGQR